MPVPTGRFEKRTARAVTVEIRPEDEGMPEERTLTENVSAHGARVLMERKWRPGQHVMVISPKEGCLGTGADCLLRGFGGKQICCRVGTVRPGGAVGKVSLAPFQVF